MPRQRMKKLAQNIPVPQSEDEARACIRKIGDKRREMLRLEADLNDKIAALKQEYGDKTAPIKDDVAGLVSGLQTYCDANRARLTKGGKVKYHEFSTGRISWRIRPPKVTIRGKDGVIEAIKALGLGKKFLRITEDINKEAMLEDAEAAGALEGVSIGSEGEDFVVEPSDTHLPD